MSKAELILPGAEDDNALVDRLTVASREIVPSVQITLAKRIIKAGSNRVVCLAARTSVPLNDDEVASVSDLALRLSDGTNVALSLSFFNENSASEYATFTHNYYDPDRYAQQTDSKLGMLVVATALAAAAAFFSLVQGPFNSLLNPKTSYAFINVPLAKWPAPPPATSPGIAPVKPAATSVVAPQVATKKSRPTSRPKVRQPRARSGRTNGNTKNSPHSSVLVPPPPPFPFSLPDGRPMSPYDPFPKMSQPASSARPAAPAKPAAQKPAAQAETTHAKTVTPIKAAAQSPPPATRVEREPAPSATPAVTKSTAAHEPAASTAAPAPHAVPTATATPPQTRSATESQPVDRAVPEREPARVPNHRTIWERPDAQIGPAQEHAAPVASQLRAPVPGDDPPTPTLAKMSTGDSPAPTQAKRWTDDQPHSGGPVPAQPKYEPIPWPD